MNGMEAIKNEKLNKDMLEKIIAAVAIAAVNAIYQYREEKTAAKKQEQKNS